MTPSTIADRITRIRTNDDAERARAALPPLCDTTFTPHQWHMFLRARLAHAFADGMDVALLESMLAAGVAAVQAAELAGTERVA